jgi:hypothetical protein
MNSVTRSPYQSIERNKQFILNDLIMVVRKGDKYTEKKLYKGKLGVSDAAVGMKTKLDWTYHSYKAWDQLLFR